MARTLTETHFGRRIFLQGLRQEEQKDARFSSNGKKANAGNLGNACTGGGGKGRARSGGVKDTGPCALAFAHRPVCIHQAGDDRNGGDFKGRARSGGVKDTGHCALAFVHRPLFIDQVGEACNGGDGKGGARRGGVKDTGLCAPAFAHRPLCIVPREGDGRLESGGEITVAKCRP